MRNPFRREQPRRAVVVGAGSFGTAAAILLERARVRTTLVCRTAEQARELREKRENEEYLSGIELPDRLGFAALDNAADRLERADLVFLAVPSAGLPDAVEQLAEHEVPRRAGVVSLAKGLVPPDGEPVTRELVRRFGDNRVACVGGPAHAEEAVQSGAGLVCASHSQRLARWVADTFIRGGVVCEVSDDPVGVELCGVAKNAASLATGATESQGLNAAGMAAADIFMEVHAWAESLGARTVTFVGRAGAGDLVATALAPSSRNRSAGQLLAEGVPASEIPERLGQASEAIETVPLLARAIEKRGLEAPVISALARLIEGELPLDDWVALVRARQPGRARRRGRGRAWLRRARAWVRHRLS
jgi:glycerol-3-phosphate dehydrogenase (NAD(P)+)